MMGAATRAVLLVCLCVAAAPGQERQPEPGITKEKPQSGRFVKTDRGYMIAYTAKIPGTKITFDMVPIPGGTVRLGSDPASAHHAEDESPRRSVTIEPCWMGRCEVTWAEYRIYMSCYDLFKERKRNRTAADPPISQADAVTLPTPIYDESTTYEFGGDPRDPAVTMTHYSARQYTKWLSLLTRSFYRLPSEAEWEHAARAGTTTSFFFGQTAERLGEYAWYRPNSKDEYHHVGLKKANPWGLHDIYGNVAEYALDEYAEDTYARLAATSSMGEAIEWPTRKYPHVIRGGSFDSPAPDLRSAARGRTDPDYQDQDANIPRSPWWQSSFPSNCVGFRLLRPLRAPKGMDREQYWAAIPDMQLDVNDRLREGRGVYGVVDRTLIRAILRQEGLREIREREEKLHR